MNRNLLTGLGIAGVVVLFLLWLSLYTVHQSMQALVLQFGEPVRVVQEPGLHMKLPVLQQVERYERRVLDYDADPLELILGDQKRLIVDTFSRYRISDPLRFRQAVGTEERFRSRMESIINSTLRNVLGEVSLFTVLSEDRSALMNRIREEANRALQQFGVELIDVRIKRADLPPENSEAIFQRMRTEREREAKELRAQGAEIAQRIRARADRERRVLIADAQRDSEVLRGEGDAQAVGIFGQAFGQDPAFFDFYRSMQAYRTALNDNSTSIVLSPTSEFFRFFESFQVPQQRAAAGIEQGSAPSQDSTPSSEDAAPGGADAAAATTDAIPSVPEAMADDGPATNADPTEPGISPAAASGPQAGG